MADGVFNIAKGKVNEYVARVDGDDPTNSALILVLLQDTGLEADSVLQDYDNLSALLAAANTEANFTNYARNTLDGTEVTAPSPDDTNNDQEAAIPDWVIASAGGAADNTISKLLVCYDPDTTAGDDTNIIPLTHHDLSVTTDGTQLTIAPSATSFFRAS